MSESPKIPLTDLKYHKLNYTKWSPDLFNIAELPNLLKDHIGMKASLAEEVMFLTAASAETVGEDMKRLIEGITGQPYAQSRPMYYQEDACLFNIAYLYPVGGAKEVGKLTCMLSKAKRGEDPDCCLLELRGSFSSLAPGASINPREWENPVLICPFRQGANRFASFPMAIFDFSAAQGVCIGDALEVTYQVAVTGPKVADAINQLLLNNTFMLGMQSMSNSRDTREVRDHRGEVMAVAYGMTTTELVPTPRVVERARACGQATLLNEVSHKELLAYLSIPNESKDAKMGPLARLMQLAGSAAAEVIAEMVLSESEGKLRAKEAERLAMLAASMQRKRRLRLPPAAPNPPGSPPA